MEMVRATRWLPQARVNFSHLGKLVRHRLLVMAPSVPHGCRRISAARLEEFVRAEEYYFAQQRFKQGMEPLTFAQLVSASMEVVSGVRQAGPSPSLEAMLRRELPIRFAARISHIKLISGWEQISELRDLQQMHVQSFRELRLAELGDNASFVEVVRNIRMRHKKVIPLFAEAIGKMRDSSVFTSSASLASDQRMEVHSLDDWAEKFVSSRISTEVLMTHYLVSMKAKGPVDPTKIGILDTRCDPHDVCLQVAENLKRGEYSSCLIRVREPCKPIQFCQTPRYLYYLVEELLFNACKATFKKCLGSKSAFEANPINITVCADDHHVVIRICDTGGGMPFEASHNMFSFSHSSQRLYLSSLSEPAIDTPTSQCSLTSVIDPGSNTPVSEKGSVLPDGNLTRLPWGVGSGFSPISGRGVSLPTCLFYARYLGGSLHIMNLPGEGVDAYLVLKLIETS